MPEWFWVILSINVFLVLIFFGIPIAFSGMLSGLTLFLLLYGELTVAGMTFQNLLIASVSNYSMTVIPLFVFMGYLAFHSGVGKEIYKVASAWVGRLPGGLAVATIFACALFGAISGSSLAATAMFAKISKPELDKAKYHWALSTGSVASAGTLASLIPPSVLIVIYGIIAEQSIGKLLIAGFIPGFISAMLYALMIIVRCILNPSLGPIGPTTTLKEKIYALPGTTEVFLVMVIILGGIYSGFFTPTEAGAWSAFIMLIFTFLRGRKIDFQLVRRALRESVVLSSIIFLALVGMEMMTKALTSSGAIGAIVDLSISLPVSRYILLFFVFIVYVILGAFIVAPGMMVLTVPFVLPVLVTAGFDPIWIGIIVIKFCEIGMITPPIGMNVYVVAPIVGRDVIDCFRSIVPFLAIDIFTVLLFVVFPEIITYVPSLMD